jgi:hypothetical protein
MVITTGGQPTPPAQLPPAPFPGPARHKHKEYVMFPRENKTSNQKTMMATPLSAMDLIHLCINPVNIREFIQLLTDYFQQYTGCQAVGVRLKDGVDYPYYETRGFSSEFVLHENKLCSVDPLGKLISTAKAIQFLNVCAAIFCARKQILPSRFLH